MEITFGNYSISSFVTVLRFVYTKELVIDLNVADILFDILSLAHKLGERDIRNSIHICNDDEMNSLQWQLLRYAHEFNEDAMKEKCWKFLDKNGSSMLQYDDFKRLPADLMTEITARSSFQCDEFALFNVCVAWANFQLLIVDSNSVRNHMQPFIKNIRFPCMTREQIREIENMGILTDSELLDIYKTFLFSDHESQFPSQLRDSPEGGQSSTAMKAEDRNLMKRKSLMKGLRYREIQFY
jgi:hypothetical protein